MSLVVKRKKKDPSSRARLSLFSPFFRSKTRSIVPSRTRSKGRPLSNHAALFLPFARARRRIRICKILGPRFLNNLENARRGEARRNNWNETTFRVQWIIPPLRREEGWEFEWSTQGGRRELGLILGGWTNERRSEDRSGLTLIVLHKAPLFCFSFLFSHSILELLLSTNGTTSFQLFVSSPPLFRAALLSSSFRRGELIFVPLSQLSLFPLSLKRLPVFSSSMMDRFLSLVKNFTGKSFDRVAKTGKHVCKTGKNYTQQLVGFYIG